MDDEARTSGDDLNHGYIAMQRNSSGHQGDRHAGGAVIQTPLI
jgi:hypothetical protein